MRISVIMPCHNAGRWINSALQSIKSQSYPAHEIIVVDDNSSDDSVAQIEQSQVPVKLLRVRFQNAAAARNAGIATATGDWVALLDADDVWYPNHLARAKELLSNSHDVAFMSNHDWISLEGNPIPIPSGFVCHLPEPKSGMNLDDFFRLERQGFHFGHSTVLYRRERLLEVGNFDVNQRRRHDLDLWLRIICGGTWTYDTLKSAGYREATPDSISKNARECDYYELRALVKNLPNIDSPLFRELLTREARRAMGIAFTDDCPEHFARIRELAWPHLPARLKFAYACGRGCPGLLRRAIKAKRGVKSAIHAATTAGRAAGQG